MDQQATRAKPRSYTEDHKRQVVDLVVSSGRTSTAVATEGGPHPTLLCRWVRQNGGGTAAVEAVRLAAAPPSSVCLFRRLTRLPRSRGCGASVP